MLDIVLAGIVAALAVACTLLYGKNSRLRAQLDSGRSQEDMSDKFEVLASGVLKKNVEEFKTNTVDPMARSMETLQRTISDLKVQNEGNAATFQTSMQDMKEANESLMKDTKTISGIRGSSQRRGKFAEVGLERVFEMSGLTKGINYYIQQTVDSRRPDFVVKLSEDRQIVIDSKAPLDALWRAEEAEDEVVKSKELDKHAKSIKDHAKSLSKKKYSEGSGRWTTW